MNNQPTITCPHCTGEIKLTESLAGPMLAELQQRFEREAAKKDVEIEKERARLKAEAEKLQAAKADTDRLVAETLKAEREKLRAEAAINAKSMLADEMEEQKRRLELANATLKDREEKLKAARELELALMKERSEIADQKQAMELTIQKRLAEEKQAVRVAAQKEAEAALSLKVQEKDIQLQAMAKQIDELKRRAEQGSQQLQGEAQEIMLEELVRGSFPFDAMEPVAKGEFGGDIVQRVRTSSGQSAGTILWESKQTKNWSDGWLTKLRSDQHKAKAEVAILVTRALPKDFVAGFGQVGEIWVTNYDCAVPLALALRQSLLEVQKARAAGEGVKGKAELTYDYLTGPRFKQRVSAIVEHFSVMKSDLDKERKAIMKMWAKREQQIVAVIDSTAGMYGDLEAIAGQKLQEIEALDFAQLEGPED